jgi:hypothetical protein
MTRQDIDLQKIQVLESSYQGWFNFKASIVAGGIVGTLILIASMQFQNIINLNGLIIGDSILTVAGVYLILTLREAHDEHINFINSLILKIEKGEKLDSIEELRQKHKDSTKKQKLKTSDAKVL